MRAGNRTTAVRWARILGDLGHRVTIAEDYSGEPADLMVALHAWRSASSVARFRERWPGVPVIVALTGTDIYRFQDSDPATTHATMDAADALIGLHDLVGEAIPQRFAGKLHVIYQSMPPPTGKRSPSKRHFDVCVIGHLREEKDPLRAALAARDLPADSKLRVIHLGAAHSEEWADKARVEMKANPRYRWLGEVPGWRVQREFRKTHLMVLSSIMEGGANVLSEAIVAGVPVIASDIPGSVGLLGADYQGYYPVGDTAALTELLHRAETNPKFLPSLARQIAKKAPLFRPQREVQAWRSLIAEVTRSG